MTSAPVPAVVFRDVVREFTVGENVLRAVDGVSFTVERGSLTVIVGPSGAGKTTVLNLLGGMDRATSGEILVDGVDITGLNKRDLCAYRREQVGFVFQFYNLIGNLTALENVELASHRRRRTSGPGQREPLDPAEVLTDVGLLQRLNNFPAQLSGGEQQRVAIARAIAKNPTLMLCDEPTGALDSTTGAAVLSLLADIAAERGVTVVLITHNLAIAPLAYRVIRLSDGRVESVTDNPSPTPAAEISW